jgi:nucleoid DNA-binding protein
MVGEDGETYIITSLCTECAFAMSKRKRRAYQTIRTGANVPIGENMVEFKPSTAVSSCDELP